VCSAIPSSDRTFGLIKRRAGPRPPLTLGLETPKRPHENVTYTEPGSARVGGRQGVGGLWKTLWISLWKTCAKAVEKVWAVYPQADLHRNSTGYPQAPPQEIHCNIKGTKSQEIGMSDYFHSVP